MSGPFCIIYSPCFDAHFISLQGSVQGSLSGGWVQLRGLVQIPCGKIIVTMTGGGGS